MGKSCLKCGNILTAIAINFIADELIEGACDLVAEGLKTTVDIIEDKKEKEVEKNKDNW